MDPKDLAGLTVYHDLLTVLKERGFSDAEAAEVFAKLTAQAEMEVVEEIMGGLNDEQMKVLDGLPDDAPADEIAEKLGLDGEEVDAIRAQKTAQLIEELVPEIDKEEDQPEQA